MEGWWAASYVVLWLLVLVLCAIVVALARQIGTLHLRLGPRGALEIDDEGPPLGEAPPDLTATDLSGRELRIGGPGNHRLLLFVSPNCLVCDRVLPSLPVASRSAGLDPQVVTDADPREAIEAFASKRVDAPIVSSAQAVDLYSVPGTPYLVVLDMHGVVRAKGTVNNLEQMEGLIETARRRLREPDRETRAV